jgi:prefoldin alpha subunit
LISNYQQPLTAVVLDPLTPESEDKSILVPLTNSLYVKGQLADPDRVLVDVGTGFYVEKVT